MTLAPGNIGGDVTPKFSLTPRNQVDAAAFGLKGIGVDMLNFESCVAFVVAGPSTGTPDSYAVNAKLQHSDVDSDGSYSDVVASVENPLVAITAITAASQNRKIEIDRRGLKRWLRIVHTVAHVGGTTPATGLASGFVCGSTIIKPVSQA